MAPTTCYARGRCVRPEGDFFCCPFRQGRLLPVRSQDYWWVPSGACAAFDVDSLRRHPGGNREGERHGGTFGLLRYYGLVWHWLRPWFRSGSPIVRVVSRRGHAILLRPVPRRRRQSGNGTEEQGGLDCPQADAPPRPEHPGHRLGLWGTGALTCGVPSPSVSMAAPWSFTCRWHVSARRRASDPRPPP